MLQETIADTSASPAEKTQPTRFELTVINIKNLAVPAIGQKTYLDSIVESFGVRVSAGGAKTYIVQGRVKGEKHSTRLKIGRVASMTLKVARERARDFLATMEAGEHPGVILKAKRKARAAQEQATRAAAEHPFGIMAERFIEEYLPTKLKESTAYQYQIILRRDFGPWAKRPLTSITPDDAVALREAVKTERGGITADHVMSIGSTLFKKWAMPNRLAKIDPFDDIGGRTGSRKRDRVLKPAELFVLWSAFNVRPTFATAWKLMLATGQRRSEVSALPKSEIENRDGKYPQWRLPAERTKNGNPHIVPLSPLAVELLRSVPVLWPDCEYVFTSDGKTYIQDWSHAKNSALAQLRERRDAIGKRTPERDAIDSLLRPDARGRIFCVHDFRRTVSTIMGEIGIPGEVVELAINHKSGKRAGIAGNYNYSEKIEERGEALAVWADFLREVTAKILSDDEVYKLQRMLRRQYWRRLLDDIDEPQAPRR